MGSIRCAVTEKNGSKLRAHGGHDPIDVVGNARIDARRVEPTASPAERDDADDGPLLSRVLQHQRSTRVALRRRRGGPCYRRTAASKRNATHSTRVSLSFFEAGANLRVVERHELGVVGRFALGLVPYGHRKLQELVAALASEANRSETWTHQSVKLERSHAVAHSPTT